MPASLIIEGMAQTAGILVGTMSSGFAEKVILAKVSKLARFDARRRFPDTRFATRRNSIESTTQGASTTGVGPA